MTTSPTNGEAFVARASADLPTARRIADTLSNLLDTDYCAVSIFETEDGKAWIAEAVFHDPADQALIGNVVERELGPGALTISTIEQRDWVAASLDGLAPVRAGRFVIHGSHDRARVRLNEIGIEIEAALAFGTGHHGTTRGCLLAFEALRKRAQQPRRWRILDIGTGTGVLAIAAARALQIPVLASDIDPQAVIVARENTRLNRAANLVDVFTAAGAGTHRFRQGGRFDLIFANILEAPLRRMSKSVCGLLAPRGRLILSGLLPAHANGVISAYGRQGLRLESRIQLDGWVTLTMRR